MKGRKLLALALTLALALGLAVPALGAGTTHADYADLMVINPRTNTPLWEWAWPTIDDAIEKGLFIGYTPYKDKDGKEIVNFGPGDDVTQAVGLTLCARMMVDKDQREQILADRLAQIRNIIPGSAGNVDDANAPYVWFRREAAVCLELGIISQQALVDLRDADRLGEAMTKAEFAKYLVRAMGLEDFAMSLNAGTLPFTDDAKITADYRPYVKVLSTYGVLTGDENGNFNPNSSMNRAVCATMLSRAIQNIVEGRKVNLELPRYTDYTWVVGTIKSVDMNTDGHRVLTLTGAFGGESTYTLPLGVNIYTYNMPGEATDLKTGAHVKLVFAKDQTTISDIRVTPAGLLKQTQGACGAVDRETVTVDGTVYTLDRFTQVSAGGKTGGPEIIDLEADYTNATVLADAHGTAFVLTLSGGQRQVDGILAGVATSGGATTITVTSFNGLETAYTLPQSALVTADGQRVTLIPGYVGKHVVLRVEDNALDQLESVEVDMDGNYVQGVLNTITTAQNGARQIQIIKTGESKRTPYEVLENCAVSFDGNSITYNALTGGVYVTAKLEGGVVTEISAWRSVEEVTGVLTGRTLTDPTVLTIRKDDGTSAQFSIPLADLNDLTILVNGKDGNLTQLSTGDTVKLTLRYHEVTQIDITPQDANVTGYLDSITSRADGTVLLNVVLTDGSTQQYTASAGTTVTRDGTAVSLSEVQAGTQIALVTQGTVALSIRLTGTATRQDTVEGVIYTKDDSNRVVTILVTINGQSKPVNIHVPGNITILDVTTGATINGVLRLSVGETIQAYGRYGADGTFEATSVIRK